MSEPMSRAGEQVPDPRTELGSFDHVVAGWYATVLAARTNEVVLGCRCFLSLATDTALAPLLRLLPDLADEEQLGSMLAQDAAHRVLAFLHTLGRANDEVAGVLG
jgi:hypothetical protein